MSRGKGTKVCVGVDERRLEACVGVKQSILQFLLICEYSTRANILICVGIVSITLHDKDIVPAVSLDKGYNSLLYTKGLGDLVCSKNNLLVDMLPGNSICLRYCSLVPSVC